MEFELVGKLTFSGEVEKLSKELKPVIDGLEPVLVKGAPRGKESEAARIVKWKASAKIIEFEIKSGRYVRAHDALLRIAKILSEELGKKHKVGLREIAVPSYRIRVPTKEVSEDARREIEKLGGKIGNGAVEVLLENLAESQVRGRIVDRTISAIEEALAKAPPKAVEEIVIAKRGAEVKHHFEDDPFLVAQNKGWLVEFPGRGQWIYTEPYARLIRALEELIVENVAVPLGFSEAMFPKLIPLEVMQRMPGYLDGVPEGMYYVCPPPREPQAFEKFKMDLKLTKKIPTEELKKVVKDPAYVLSPAQCEPFYQGFASKYVNIEKLPVKLYDMSGWTYRWEGGGVEGLIRTQEFRRIEFVMLGSPDDVISIREDVVEKSIELVEKLGLEWRIPIATPFYMKEGGAMDASDSRKVATYDLEVLLPYNEKWLEIGSYNAHKTKFTETFKIKEVKGREVWTGCCGFGTSRWVVGFLAQHGFDTSRWPEPVRKKVGTLPSPVKVTE
ncbi:MAG: aminoacyl--tRNA ligase-related protein [Candidatus Hadarchaeota archaeon]